MFSMNKAVAVRVLIFVFAWINQFLVSKGQQPLPVLGEAEVAFFVTFIASVWTLVADNKGKKGGETK